MLQVERRLASMVNTQSVTQGRNNRALIRQWFTARPGATQVECAEALGLSRMVVHRHVKAMRDEWQRLDAMERQARQ